MNLSSSFTADDLVGRLELTLNPDSGIEEFSFKQSDFAKSFSNGYFFLLDELNLASDDVLHRIETALDTGVLLTPSNPTKQLNGMMSFGSLQLRTPTLDSTKLPDKSYPPRFWTDSPLLYSKNFLQKNGSASLKATCHRVWVPKRS